ncbi:hypothetical protein GWK47_024376 [Chionoecetes opilio]|uniref:Uncharacterized protein n=1 Tax=Chionoecetes opilio TaxID=41210 RepID=A0A8J4XNH7_CHIOP|nr:hypothetical protein GWK47_024376 [Chionoecetes opilio]
MFHSFTGCDTTSAFFGKGNKSAWEAWNAYVEVTEAFNNFMNHPYMTVTVNCKQFQLLERFTVIIYNKTSNLDSVNEARRELFSQKNRPMEKIPPTQKALLQHTLRAVYQAGIWATSDQCEQKPPTPEGFGWTLESATKTWRPCVVQPACSISGLQRTGQVWLQKRHVRRTMLMQEGAVEVHRTMQLPM